MKTLTELEAESMAAVVAEVAGRKVTRGELREAFKKVEPEGNWKFPIDCRVKVASKVELAMIKEAVVFFTGSVPHFSLVGHREYRVEAAGYYRTIGA